MEEKAALVELLRRRELDYLEEAEALARLMGRYGLSQEQAAAKVGMSQSAVANKLRILKHPPQVLEALRRTGLTQRHARVLLRLPEACRREAVEVMAAGGYSVAQAEAYVEALLLREEPKEAMGAVMRRLDRSLAMIRSAGIHWDQEETEREIVVTIRVRKTA